MTRKPELAEVTKALDTLAELGPGHLDPADLREAAALRNRIDERLAKGDGLTVAAFAGGTGVGKSALVNRVVGHAVATEGVRRPTTDHPVAVTGTYDDATAELLAWLDIADHRTVGDRVPSGLVLVDLPDHDSVAADHRRTASRLAQRVDALVVVVDPLKYARADLHHGPLAELTAHAEVVTVVLNRIDELSQADLARCRADLERQLDKTGVTGITLLATSATVGTGTDDLRDHLRRLAARQEAVTRRLTGDAAVLARRVRTTLPEPHEHDLEVSTLLEPLLEATDAHRALVEAQDCYRRDVRAAVRSPLARRARMPLEFAVRAGDRLGLTDRASVARPGRSGEPLARVLGQQLRLHDATGTTHAALGRSIDETTRLAAPRLTDAVDRVPIRPDRRAWWTVMAWLRGGSELAALVGFGWLLLLAVVGWLQLPEVPTPQVTDDLSWPAALFLYGLGARVVAGLATRGFTAAGVRRHVRRTDRGIRERLADAIRAHVLEPFAARRRRHRTVREQLDVLAGTADERDD